MGKGTFFISIIVFLAILVAIGRYFDTKTYSFDEITQESDDSRPRTVSYVRLTANEKMAINKNITRVLYATDGWAMEQNEVPTDSPNAGQPSGRAPTSYPASASVDENGQSSDWQEEQEYIPEGENYIEGAENIDGQNIHPGIGWPTE
ncbi:MAG: hypothetical protein A2504_10570 [Bdellovibrionales bacterium RIFOXYD12_FULL_39_22]|nr:MAG: hypothetical protein A2385_14205 [Bdellovibrionales bacterium RIFOXYB1_FULL_39_21]OFZ40388.1 MAG: hypothetical protein A2485_02895 [Bdellovibrionales bacterium RIFOXYC12_FULL_39_17]OFZ49637.1 MAG: hypothetical protein A2404_09355 [Bdellovibrionales bacterium RIFOXYC1_FULL_39_130]OFZ74335.1 MAG: hypothetical protein A2451_03670 [Bdellovibrionales bacterium RIFOXYC2_FULL_39_8]OFZ77307.1 MAG: hypothetical protein A2560_06020 [Bdellovibrionales bacterium RIFOXYD1_FULL_39_84]OFZ95962.1 MAG: